MAGQQFVEQDAQGVDITGGSDRLASNLLWAGVIRCHRTQPHRFDCLKGRFRIEHLSNTKVQQFGDAFDGNEDVAGLEVAVDDVMLVRVLDGGANGTKEFQPLDDRELVGVAVRVDRKALDVIHDEVS